MSKQIVEVVYGKHRIFHVLCDRGLLSTTYAVRSHDGKVSASFNSLEKAVAWARQAAEKS